MSGTNRRPYSWRQGGFETDLLGCRNARVRRGHLKMEASTSRACQEELPVRIDACCYRAC